jgi:hypothetical protein
MREKLRSQGGGDAERVAAQTRGEVESLRSGRRPFVTERITGLGRLPFGRQSEVGCKRKKGEIEAERPPRYVSDH